MSNSPGSSLERHIQTVVQIVIASILLWTGSTILAVKESVIRLEESNKQTKETLTTLRDQIATAAVKADQAASESKAAIEWVKSLRKP